MSSQEKVLLQDVLLSYSDVFAQNEFDLGNFTAIEHNIDTGDAAPIKQRLRRTPACYVGEEEKHLYKLLDAGVIEPSISDWASAPVYSFLNEIVMNIHIASKTRLASVTTIMADEVKVKSTSRDLSVVPTITFGFVEDIVRKCSKSDGAKEITKGYKYFSEKYVTDVRGNCLFSVLYDM